MKFTTLLAVLFSFQFALAEDFPESMPLKRGGQGCRWGETHPKLFDCDGIEYTMGAATDLETGQKFKDLFCPTVAKWDCTSCQTLSRTSMAKACRHKYQSQQKREVSSAPEEASSGEADQM